MNNSFQPPVPGAVLLNGNHGQQVITCQRGTEETSCIEWNAERMFSETVVRLILLRLDMAKVEFTAPAPVAGAVLEVSKHGRQVITCRIGAEESHCADSKAERLYSNTDVQALLKLVEDIEADASATPPKDLFSLQPVSGATLEISDSANVVLVKRGDENAFCQTRNAERLYRASHVIALQAELAKVQANEALLKTELQALRGQLSKD